MAFDEKKYKKIFESRYGSGSFDSGLSDARNIGRLKVQADVAKQDYMTRVRAAQKIAKAKKAAEDMGAQDVVNAFIREQQDKENVQASNASLKATNPIKGAGTTGESYWASKGIPVGYGTSKPTPKAPDKKWVNPYTRDDLKAALAAIKKAKDTTTQDSYAKKFNTIGTNKGSSISAYDMMQTFQKKVDPNNTPAGTTRFFDTLQTKGYNSTMKKRQEDFMMDPSVSPQHDKYLQQQKLAKEKEKAQLQRANDTLAAIQQDATRRNVYNSGTGNFLQEAERGIARGANAITLGSLGELYKKLHHGEESQQLMDRKGKAGWLDKGSDFAGSVVPFIASDGLLGGVGALGKLGAKGVAGKVGELALRGAGSGAIVSAGQEGVKAAFNPHQFDPKQALENVALNTALGAVANPLLHGAGKGANKLFNLKGQLNQVLKGSTKYNQQDFQKALEEAFAPKGNVSNVVADQAKVMPKPFESKINLPTKGNKVDPVHPETQLKDIKSKIDQLHPIAKDYQHEFKDAVQKQYEYLKNSMGKGVEFGTTGHGLGNFREVNGSFRVSNNPKWYQDFYKQTGRKPTNAELRQLAEDHVRNGFQDEGGSLPAWQPKKLQEIDNQIEEVTQMIHENPEQAGALQPILDALQEDKAITSKEVDSALNELPGLKKQHAELTRRLNTQNGLMNLPNGSTLKTPDLNINKSPVERLQELLSNTTKQNEAGALPITPSKTTEKPLFMSMGGKVKPPTPKVEQPIKAAEKRVVLRSVKPTKDVNAMSKEELQTVHKQLVEQQQALSRTKTRTNKQKIQEVQDDMAKVEGLLVKLNLQHFGESAHIPSDQLPDTSVHIGTKTKREVPGLGVLKNKAYIKTIDNLHPLNEFDKMVEKATGDKLKPSESSYTLGLNSRGSDQISKQILTQNMVNKNGEVIGKSLKEIASQIPKGKLKNFEDYLINKHAITRMERGEKVFPDEMQMTPDKSRAIIKKYDEAHPEFKGIAKEYYEYNKQLGQKWLVDNGVLSKEEWAGYLKANPHYVPNNRMFKDIERPVFGNNAKKGFSNQSNPIKKATGSQRKIVSPMESTIEHTDKYVKTAKRNEVMQTVINNIQKDPEAFKGFAEIVPTKETPQSIADTLKTDGVDGVLEHFNQGFEQKPDLTKGNIVFGLIDGKKVHVKVHDPQFLEALTNLQPKAQNVVIQAVGKLTRTMKVLTTGVNPVFSLTRNVFRDIPTAYVNSKTTNNPVKFAFDLLDAFTSVSSHTLSKNKLISKIPGVSTGLKKKGDLYQLFQNVGGGHSSSISSDINLLGQSKQAILPDKITPKTLFRKGIGALENLNNAVESAPRLAEFKRLTKNDPSYDAKMKGLYEANDVTVNFNKYGNTAKDVDAIVPYLNAALQGLDKTFRVIKDNPIKSSVKAFTAVTVPTVVLYAVNHKNPDYQQLSNYIKDNNFLIPNGDGTFTKIPKPRELGMMFSSNVERAMKMWVDQDPKAFNKFADSLLTNFIPPKRTIFAPFQDVRANKNFMDTPIVPGDLQNLSPKYQYDSKTSELAKKLGSIFNKSPKQLDYLMQSYGGGLAELGLPALTKDATIKDTLKQKVTADPTFSNDILGNFYDAKTKLDQAQSDFKKQGVNSPERNDALRKLFSKTSGGISDVRKSIKALQGDSTLTPSERQKQIRILQQRINQMAQNALKLNDSR